MHFDEKDPSERMLLENKESGIPVLNVGEFLFNTNP
jgi:hypothetical protein